MQNWLDRYVTGKSAAVGDVQQLLKQLAATRVATDLPNIEPLLAPAREL